MPDLPTIAGGPSETASTPGSSAGINLTNPGSANTKGSWIELIASTDYDTDWLLVSWYQPSSGTNAGYAMDIGLGASTSEQVLIPDVYAWVAQTTGEYGRFALFPIRIPRASRISGRMQATTTTDTLHVGVTAMGSPIGSPPGFDRVEACGVTTSAATTDTVLNDPGGTAHTDGTYTQIIASTAFAYKWMIAVVHNRSDISMASRLDHLLDLAVGGGGSETNFISDLYIVGNSDDDATQAIFSFPVNIAAGQRLSAHHRCSSITAGDRRLSIALYGVG